MNKITQYFAITFLFIYCFLLPAHSQSLYQIELKEDIGPNAWRMLNNGFKKAEELKSDVILIDMNTFGGAVNFADSIRTRLLNSSIKTVVYINNNAASAGALIALASDEIYMHTGASIGAASVVNAEGEIMPEKYQSYMRGLMRATAEAKGRDPKIAESFVDPEVSADGKLLTLSASEATKIGLAVAEVKNITEVYEKLNINDPNITIHQVTLIDKIIALLINPAVSGLLILLIIGGIYAEMQSPGIGFALVVAIIAAVLFFAPLYIQGLADNWEIAIFVLGLVLIALEIFVIPGFGVAGILGIIFTICGLTFSLVANDFLDFKLAYPGMLFNSFLIVSGAMVLAVILMVIFGRNLMRSSAFKRLVLHDEQNANEGYTSSALKSDLLHKQGIAKTVLRPSGKIEIDGVWYDAVALDGFVDVGELVQVEKHENYNLFVRKLTT